MTTSVPLEMTQEEFDEISTAEAVVVREYERADGSRFASVIEHGELAEMQDRADRVEMYIRFNGQPKVIGQHAILVSKLLGGQPQ